MAYKCLLHVANYAAASFWGEKNHLFSICSERGANLSMVIIDTLLE